MEGGIFWKKLVHKCDKRGVEGGKNLKKSINVEGGFFFWRVEFFKIGKRDVTFIREMRVTVALSANFLKTDLKNVLCHAWGIAVSL